MLYVLLDTWFIAVFITHLIKDTTELEPGLKERRSGVILEQKKPWYEEILKRFGILSFRKETSQR